MHFVMAIGEKIIESVEVKRELAKNADYLQALKTMLEHKHWLTVAAYQKEPQFYLQVPSGKKKLNN